MNDGPQFGALLLPDGHTRFHLWAPSAKTVDLMLEIQELPMRRCDGGWFVLEATAVPGMLYRYRIDGKLLVPDPASHFQPVDVHGPGELIDHDYPWQAKTWRSRPWHEAVICELHVGTFSESGTYEGVTAHLDHLAQTGITAIELMPLADFPGRRNWGYDGVLHFAPDSAYGRPDDLKALIDAAHQRGLMVLLDVVYNHFGPDGNYLAAYAPQFFTDEFDTPWGAAIDYRTAPVRDFAVQNAVHWLKTYRFDGLRLDAVHAIRARGEPSILEAIAQAAAALAAQEDRQIHLVLENDDNAAALLQPGGSYRAQWNDDYHHAWHVLLTGESEGYYEDYVEPIPRLRRALTQGFVYQGEISRHRGGASRGEQSEGLPPTAFVNFLQNHDQIGNRPYGDRLEALAAPQAIEAALAVTLLAPQIPLLFMGEEWGSTQNFPFFCDFTGELAIAVEEGRRREFAAQYRQSKDGDEPPSALQAETFEQARLDWSARERPPHNHRLALVRELLALRRRHVMPLLAGGSPKATALPLDVPLLAIEWRWNDKMLHLLANLSPRKMAHEASDRGDVIWGKPERNTLAPWQVIWRLA